MHAKKVTLREKPMLGHRKSLYLDFYPPIAHPKTGKQTRRLFLNLFVYTPIRLKERKNGEAVAIYADDSMENSFRENHNATSIAMATHIFNEWRNKLLKPEIYTELEKKLLKQKELGQHCFVTYFKELIKKRNGSNSENWASTLIHLKEFTNGSIKFNEVDEKWCENLKHFLLSTGSKRDNKNRVKISNNTAFCYFNKIRAALRQAFKEGYLTTNLNERITGIRLQETQRNFLTIEELNALVKTECDIPIIKTAGLFSCLTGLRYSDIEKLEWKDVEHSKTAGCFIRYQQKKTKNYDIIHLSKQAVELLGGPGKGNEKVFVGLKYGDINNGYLEKWLLRAGISKYITFHCFRHTYATLQLSAGTDITTISKMLGHRNYKTTQIYAKVVDQAKINAAEKIQLDM